MRMKLLSKGLIQIDPIWTVAAAVDVGLFQANWAGYRSFYLDLCHMSILREQIIFQRLQIDLILMGTAVVLDGGLFQANWDWYQPFSLRSVPYVYI